MKNLPWPERKKTLLIPAFSVHPLHNQDFVDYIERSEPGGYFANRHRRTGRSTAIALSSIAEAIRAPGKPIRLADHYHGRTGLEHLVHLVEQSIHQLGLREMSVFKDRDGTFLVFGGKPCL